MKYIVHKRFKSKAICGYVNLPALTECECVDGRIVCNGKIICNERSENADYEDFWLWNHDFYQADIDVLRHIAKLVGAKEDT